MSILVCTWCGTSASDNEVTWDMFYDATEREIVVACDACDTGMEE